MRCLKPAAASALLAPIVLCIFLGLTGADPDLFARVAAGRLAESGIALRDPFAFTKTKDIWVDHEWLAGFFFWKTAKYFGDFGLFVLKWFFACASIFFLAKAQEAAENNRRALGLVLLFVAALGSTYIWTSTIRAQVFTYLFIPIFLWILIRADKKGAGALLWTLPIFMTIWLNAHGGFVLGLALQGVYALRAAILKSREAGAAMLSFLLSLASTGINPYGFLAYWDYILHALSMPRPSIPEWAPIRAASLEAVPLIILAALIGLGLVLEKSRETIFPALAILASLALAFRTSRLAALYFMTVCVYGPSLMRPAIDRVFSEGFRLKLARAGITAALLALAFGLYRAIGFLSAPARFELDRSAYPEEELAWLKTNREVGNVLVDFNVGSYALFRLYPRFRISLDGRYEEVYPESTVHLVADALQVSSPSQVESITALSPDFILAPKSDAEPLLKKISSDWILAFCGQRFCLLERPRSDSNKRSQARSDITQDLPANSPLTGAPRNRAWSMDF